MTPHAKPRRTHSRSPSPPHDLVVGGDWACAHNNIGTLRHVAGTLAREEGGELRDRLLEIERLCVDDSEAALGGWCAVREMLRH